MTQNRIYCTYFDKNYLLQGITMITSLRNSGENEPVIVLALDSIAERFLNSLNLSNVLVISLELIEQKYPELLSAKINRNKVEYYFTLTPAILSFACEKYENINATLIYVDADLFFFDNPLEIFLEMKNSSIGIIPHRFNISIEKKLRKYGLYNVGMVLFKNDFDGRKVLRWWFKSCLDWCFDFVENGRFADQKYLESFSNLSIRVRIIEHIGANVAPWNISNYKIGIDQKKVKIDEEILIFYHFHKLKFFKDRFLTPHIYYKSPFTNDEKLHIYSPYIAKVLEISSKINYPINLDKSIFSREVNLFAVIKVLLINILVILKGNTIKIQSKKA